MKSIEVIPSLAYYEQEVSRNHAVLDEHTSRIEDLKGKEVRLWRPTDRETLGGDEQKLAVCITSPDKPKGLIVQVDWFMRGFDPENPLDSYFRAAVAAQTDCAVATISMPGIPDMRTNPEAGLSRTQRSELFSGGASEVAQAMTTVLYRVLKDEQTLSLPDNIAVAPVTASLSTGVGPALTQSLIDKNLNVAGLGMIEPVGLEINKNKIQQTIATLRMLGEFCTSHPYNELHGKYNGEQHHREMLAQKTGQLLTLDNFRGALRTMPYGYLLTSGKSTEPLFGDTVARYFQENNGLIQIAVGTKSEFPDMVEQSGNFIVRLQEEIGEGRAKLYVIENARHGIAVSAHTHAAVAQDVLRRAA